MNTRSTVFLVAFGIFWSTLTLVFDAFIFGSAARQLRATGKILSGRYDLILDELNHTLELPLTTGLTERRSVAWSSIRGMHVETVLKPRNRGGQSGPSYVPTLSFQGGAQPEGLVEWYNEEKARELVAWLREKIEGKTSHAISHD